MKIDNVKSFMAHLPKGLHNELLEALEEYNIIKYLIAYEEEPYSHYHFMIEFSEEPDKNYHNFCKRIFIDKHKLSGRAKNGKPRQYGAVKKIENLERMLAYTLKEGNFITNIEDQEIQKLIEIAKGVTKFHTFREKLLKHLWEKKLDAPTSNYYLSSHEENTLEQKVRREVINYYLEKEETNLKLNKSFIENIYLEYIIKHKTLKKEEKTEILYYKFFYI